MSRKKSGFYFEFTAWDSQELNLYLSLQESKALLFVIEASKVGDGTIHPYDLAHFLWPEDYPLLSRLSEDERHILKNGEYAAMDIISSIKKTFSRYRKRESILGVYDPFPFYLAEDPEIEFRSIMIHEGIKVIKYYPANEQQPRE